MIHLYSALQAVLFAFGIQGPCDMSDQQALDGTPQACSYETQQQSAQSERPRPKFVLQGRSDDGNGISNGF